jgi:hypothetical protein
LQEHQGLLRFPLADVDFEPLYSSLLESTGVESCTMMSAIVSKSAFNARHTAVALKLGAHAAVVGAKLRTIAPYALIELILPGGSVMALLLWLYRRQRKHALFASDEILSLL